MILETSSNHVADQAESSARTVRHATNLRSAHHGSQAISTRSSPVQTRFGPPGTLELPEVTILFSGDQLCRRYLSMQDFSGRRVCVAHLVLDFASERRVELERARVLALAVLRRALELKVALVAPVAELRDVARDEETRLRASEGSAERT